MVNLSEIANIDHARLVSAVSPALRVALDRQMAARSESEASFCSFISGPK